MRPGALSAQFRDDSPPRRPLDEPELEQVRLVDVLDRVGLLAERDGQRREADRPAAELVRDRPQEVAIDPLEARLVAVEGLDAIVWEADPLTLRFTFVSQRAEEMLGYPVERWLDEPDFWPAILHPDDAARWRTEVERCSRERNDCRFEFRVVAADGHTVWLENVVHAASEEDGRTDSLHGVMLDATGRKRLEEEHHRLLASEQAARAEAEAAVRRAKFLAEASEVLASSLDHEATLKAVTQLAVPDFADWVFVHLVDATGQRRLHAAHADPVGDTVARSFEVRE